MGNKKNRKRKHARQQNDDEAWEKNKQRMKEQRAKLREEQNAHLVQETLIEENYGKFLIICIFNSYKLPTFFYMHKCSPTSSIFF